MGVLTEECRQFFHIDSLIGQRSDNFHKMCRIATSTVADSAKLLS
jgi:hypothetical protein